MDLEKLCCYSERECNEPVARDTGYCESHILSSRFAEELGYRQCAYKNNQKVSSSYESRISTRFSIFVSSSVLFDHL